MASTIQIRIDPKLKKKSSQILEKIGLDMSSAIKLFLSSVVTYKGLPPYRIITENGLTLEQENEILKLSEEAKKGKNIVSFKNIESFKSYIEGENDSELS